MLGRHDRWSRRQRREDEAAWRPRSWQPWFRGSDAGGCAECAQACLRRPPRRRSPQRLRRQRGGGAAPWAGGARTAPSSAPRFSSYATSICQSISSYIWRAGGASGTRRLRIEGGPKTLGFDAACRGRERPAFSKSNVHMACVLRTPSFMVVSGPGFLGSSRLSTSST